MISGVIRWFESVCKQHIVIQLSGWHFWSEEETNIKLNPQLSGSWSWTVWFARLFFKGTYSGLYWYDLRLHLSQLICHLPESFADTFCLYLWWMYRSFKHFVIATFSDPDNKFQGPAQTLIINPCLIRSTAMRQPIRSQHNLGISFQGAVYKDHTVFHKGVEAALNPVSSLSRNVDIIA